MKPWLFIAFCLLTGLSFGGFLDEETILDRGERLTVSQNELFYVKEGVKPPVIVLLHGFGASVYSWDKVYKPLAEVSTVIAYDRPGFGYSSRVFSLPEGAYNPYLLENQDEILFDLVDSVAGSHQSLILVGHSAGAAVAVEAYFQKPDRIAALILESPALESHGPPQTSFSFDWSRVSFSTPLVKIILTKVLESAIGMAWHDPSTFTEKDRYYYKKPLEIEGWEVALQLFTLSQTPRPFVDRLNEIAVPVLYITGAEDRVIPPNLTESYATATPDAELKVIPLCGHVAHEEQTETFIRSVIDFLNDRQLVE